MKSKSIMLVATLALIHLAVIVPCGQVTAQELLDVDIYDAETIYLYQGFFSDGFVKDGRIMDIGFLGSDLAKALAESEYALEEMRKARKFKVAGMITNFVAAGFSVTGIVLTFRDNDNRALEISSIVVGAICGILADGFNRSATAAMSRAVWLYNRDVVSGRLRTTSGR